MTVDRTTFRPTVFQTFKATYGDHVLNRQEFDHSSLMSLIIEVSLLTSLIDSSLTILGLFRYRKGHETGLFTTLHC